MEIDFSPLASSINALLFGIIKVIGVPIAGALLVGFILWMIKVPWKIVFLVVILVFGYGVYQSFMVMEN